MHKLLGKGSYGKVYKVERESDKQLYALKEADLGAMSQPERADAVNEVRLLVSISHPNVVSACPLPRPRSCLMMAFVPHTACWCAAEQHWSSVHHAHTHPSPYTHTQTGQHARIYIGCTFMCPRVGCVWGNPKLPCMNDLFMLGPEGG